MTDRRNMESIYSVSASNFVLGSLMNNTRLVYSSQYPIGKDDFKPFLIHKIIYVCISQLADSGVENVEPIELVNYLTTYPSQLNSLKEELNDGDIVGYITTLKGLTDNNHNYTYWWTEVKKRTLLRSLNESKKFDISNFWDFDKDIEENDKSLNKYTINDIIDSYSLELALLKNAFVVDEDTTEKRAGDRGKEILEALKNNITMGYGLESEYLTTLWGGVLKSQVYIRSGDTSSGKSRSIIGDICRLCVSEIFNTETNQWEANPNGEHQGLYIGTEMELDYEVDPIVWAYVSGVDSSKIIHGNLTAEEEERVLKAQELVGRCLELVDMPTFDIDKVEEKIRECKLKHDIEVLGFDYILLNTQLVKEFVEGRGSGVGARGDEILGELAKALKNMAKRYNIAIITATQVNSSISDYKNRDYQVLRGSKQIADTCTGGSISMPITLMEKKLVEGLINSCPTNKHRVGKPPIEPNFVETVYKSRFSEFPKECKIFSYYNLGNMRRVELFVTDKNFEPINVPKTRINFI